LDASRSESGKQSDTDAGGLLSFKGFDAATKLLVSASPVPSFPLHKRTAEVAAVYPHCGVGCGIIMAVREGEIIGIEGDPHSPVNQTPLGTEVSQYLSVPIANPALTTVKDGAPGAAS